MKNNKEAVVKITVMGEVAHPKKSTPFRLTGEGIPFITPGTGGITYNYTVGDSAFKMFGDHVEPDVTTKNYDSQPGTLGAYMTYSCIGNEATVVSGDAKGKKGYVIGKHGGINDVMIVFGGETKNRLVIGDKIQVKAWGQGMLLPDYPDIRVYNIDPELLEKIPVTEDSGCLRFPVAAVIPGYLMGSGSGAGSPIADYDIITHDKSLIGRLGLDKLRIGDFVALENHNNSFGLGGYREGAITIGVIVHSDCMITGHGPGMTVVLTSPRRAIVPEIVENSNLVDYLPLEDLE